MTIEQTIKKAIEGGWNSPYQAWEARWEKKRDDYIKEHHITREEYDAHPPTFFSDDALGFPDDPLCFLDSKFWQSLGKAMGWEMDCKTEYNLPTKSKLGHRATPHTKYCRGRYLSERRSFIDHLAEGKDINSFFETL